MSSAPAAKRLTRLAYTAAARSWSAWTNRAWRHPGTAVLDLPRYRGFCAAAASDTKVFREFRRDSFYRLFVENNSADEGRYYLEAALAGCPHYDRFLDRFRTGDRFGAPGSAAYGKRGRFAPTTLRHIKHLSDCERLFGAFDSKIVAEIGSGYGGLAKLFFDRFDLERYVLIDLPEPLSLARRFLASALGEETVRQRCEFVDASDSAQLASKLGPQYFDLAVSVRGFSSCRFDVQKKYIHFVLNSAANGYLVCDSLAGAFGVRRHSDEEILLLLQKEVEIESDPGWWWDDTAAVWTWNG